MRRDEQDRVAWRTTGFDQMEDRLVLSADPLTAMASGSLMTHGEQIELHVQPIGTYPGQPDFFQAEDPILEGAAQTNAAANQYSYTGLGNVQNNFGLTGSGQTVVVIDTGIAWDHQALGAGFGAGYRVVGGWDFAENDANPYDDGPGGFHGTHVAGIVGGAGTYSGVATGVDLVALRVFNDQGAGYFNWVESALQWVHQNRHSFANPITTVNLSIGTNWNANTVPGWSTLEDEFAQLKADGIFVAVSAGNSFTSYNAAGLSYPASSPHVVPVASVGAGGNLSSFSQRNDRVIAAPGEAVTSTVPDYAGNNDGVKNDYASVSGTSMAAPYLAGSSVLIRQAMQFAGVQNITQDMIYDVMRTTADKIYDSATGLTINRLNLERAITSVMPADDFGSTAATAHSLGTLSGTQNFSGIIGQKTDVDYFRFTASGSGTVTFTTQTADGMSSVWKNSSGQTIATGNTVTMNVVAGQSYTIGLTTAEKIGHYQVQASIQSSLPPATQWGAVVQSQFNNQAIAGDNWYRFSATRDGLLSIQAAFNAAGGNVTLKLYDSNMQQVTASGAMSTSNVGNGTQRLDYSAASGQSFYLQVTGTNSSVNFQLQNIVQQVGSTVAVNGTAGNDTISVTAGTTHTVTINGVSYQFAAAAVSTINVNAGSGNDTVRFTGTAGNDTATLRPTTAELQGSGYRFTANGAESTVMISGGGNDTANMYDSAGNDVFTAAPTNAVLSCATFSNRAEGFTRVNAFATGGSDKAYLSDSAGNDRFYARPDYALMDGAGFYNYTSNFDEVYAYATSGNDTAYLYDSAGDDTFIGRPEFARLTGAGYFRHAGGFDRAYAYASTGNDRAYLYDSAGNDRFYARPEYALLDGAGFYNYVANFDVVDGIAGFGNDTAYLYDSAGDDQFIGTPEYARMNGAGYFSRAAGFDRAYAYASTGNDRAYLYDSAGNDRFYARPEYALLDGAGFYNYVTNFDLVDGFASTGNDTAYLYDSAGDDQFIGRPESARMCGAGYLSRAANFDRVNAYATSGYDRAYFYDSSGSDRYYSDANCALLDGAGFYNVAFAFDRAEAFGGSGGVDRAYLYGATSGNTFTLQATLAQSQNVSTFSRVNNFGSVSLYGARGGSDRVNVQTGTGNDTFLGRDNFARLVGNGYDLTMWDAAVVSLSRAASGNHLIDVATGGDTGAVDYLFELMGN